jgi:hypothetical protein
MCTRVAVIASTSVERGSPDRRDTMRRAHRPSTPFLFSA